MPTDTLQATANGTDNNWANTGGAARWNSVLPPDDADTTYVSLASAVGNSRQNFAFQDLDAAARGIQTHTLTRRCRKVSGSTSNVKGALLLGGVYVDGASVIFGASYANQSDVDLARPGGGTWVPDDINNAQPGLVRGGGGADEDRCTTLTWVVAWQAEQGDFAAFAAGHIGLIGGGLLLAEMWKVAKAILEATRRKTLVTPYEYALLHRELIAHPYRSYAF